MFLGSLNLSVYLEVKAPDFLSDPKLVQLPDISGLIIRNATISSGGEERDAFQVRIFSFTKVYLVLAQKSNCPIFTKSSVLLLESQRFGKGELWKAELQSFVVIQRYTISEATIRLLGGASYNHTSDLDAN